MGYVQSVFTQNNKGLPGIWRERSKAKCKWGQVRSFK